MRYLLSAFLSLLLLSCSGQKDVIADRLATTEKILQCLKGNQPDQLMNYLYSGTNTSEWAEIRGFMVKKASRFINKFGLPDRSKWKVNLDPKDQLGRLFITIPLFSGYDAGLNLEKADVVITFPPPQVSDKAASVEVEDQYKMTQIQPVRQY